MPHEAKEQLFLLLFAQRNIRRPVVKGPDVVRGDSHFADRLPYVVARGAADMEEDRMGKNQCHDRMTRKGGQREQGNFMECYLRFRAPAMSAATGPRSNRATVGIDTIGITPATRPCGGVPVLF